jgi:hypothetical protein
MPTGKRSQTYTAYILRCWREEAFWRYSLEELSTRKRYGFAGLDDFISFLLARSNEPDLHQDAEDSPNDLALQSTKGS